MMLVIALFFIPNVFLFAASPNIGGGVGDSNVGGSIGTPNVGGSNSGFQLVNPLAHGSTLCELLNAVFSVTITLGIPIAVVFMVIAGLKFVLALGNPTGLKNAKKNFMYTVLGIALFVGAWFLAQVIARTLVQLGGSGFNTCF